MTDTSDNEGDDIINDNEVDAEEICVNEGRKAVLEKIRQVEIADSGAQTPSEKRLSYLMAQSEIFSHFLMGDAGDAKAEEKKPGPGRRKSSSSSSSSGASQPRGGRARKSEASEDRELLKQAQSAAATVTRLHVQPRAIIGGTMRAYQLEGLNWLVKLYDNNVNGILADEMGLGKTLQTISLLAYLLEFKKIRGPHLVVVPKATVSNWIKEFNRWCGYNSTSTGSDKLRVVRLLGDKAEREAVVKTHIKTGEFDVIVTSYEGVIKEQSSLKKIRWKYLVVDEAHRLKNENSLLSRITRMLMTEFRLLITGTPLQNNLHELWALLNFLMPEVFSSATSFDTWFNIVDKAATDNVIKKLHTVLKPFMLRRIKIDVEKDLPPKIETKLYVGMSAMQKEWYVRVLKNDMQNLNALGGPERSKLLNVLMQLRKVCNHPYLFDGAEEGPPFQDGPHLWESSGKMALLDKLLPKLKAQGSRVLIFSQMTRMLDILEDYMNYQGFTYTRIDGSHNSEERDANMEAFNAPNSPIFSFLLSTRAGGLGINLQTADIVILFDSDWNPQVDLQAQDRAHRIGQKKTVRVFRFVTDNSVDVKIIERADRKLFLDAAVIQQGRLADKMGGASLGKGELMTMVKFGADEIMKSKEGTLTDEDIDQLLDRGEKRTAAENDKLSTEMKHNLANFAINMEKDEKASAEFNLFTFEGENWKGKRKHQMLVDDGAAGESAGLFMSVPQRDKKRASYSVKEYHKQMHGLPMLLMKNFRKKKYDFPDYQFFNVARLAEIAEVENTLHVHKQIVISLIKELITRERRARKQAASAHASAVKKAAKAGTQIVETEPPPAAGHFTAGIIAALGIEPDAPLAVLVCSATADDSNDEVMNAADAAKGIPNQRPGPRTESSRLQYMMDCRQFDLIGDPELYAEKQALMAEGFRDWSKQDYKVVLDAVERFGLRDAASYGEPDDEATGGETEGNSAVLNIANEVCSITYKDPALVKRYVTTFVARYTELNDAVKIAERAERAEKRVAKEQFLKRALRHKVMRLREELCKQYPRHYTVTPANFQSKLSFPWGPGGNNIPEVASFEGNDYAIPILPCGNTNVLAYGHWYRSKNYSEDADIFLIMMMHHYGYGQWEKIRREIRFNNHSSEPRSYNNYQQVFQFDWYFKSRSSLDIERRCDVLLRMVEKEYEKFLRSAGKGGDAADDDYAEADEEEEEGARPVVEIESKPVEAAPVTHSAKKRKLK